MAILMVRFWKFAMLVYCVLRENNEIIYWTFQVLWWNSSLSYLIQNKVSVLCDQTLCTSSTERQLKMSKKIDYLVGVIRNI